VFVLQNSTLAVCTASKRRIVFTAVGRITSLLRQSATNQYTTFTQERVEALADISRSALYAFAVYKAISLQVYVIIVTKPVHRLQIRPTVHN